jgi:hypothetical protein
MKAIGIEIDKKRAICFALERDQKGNLSNITGKQKFIEIKDDQDNAEIRSFVKTIQQYFDGIKPDAIAIITRQTKGRFSASPYSFKLEGLIQCYENVNIEFVSPQTLTAFFKKNELAMTYENKYQENAMRLASYLLIK